MVRLVGVIHSTVLVICNALLVALFVSIGSTNEGERIGISVCCSYIGYKAMCGLVYLWVFLYARTYGRCKAYIIISGALIVLINLVLIGTFATAYKGPNDQMKMVLSYLIGEILLLIPISWQYSLLNSAIKKRSIKNKKE